MVVVFMPDSFVIFVVDLVVLVVAVFVVVSLFVLGGVFIFLLFVCLFFAWLEYFICCLRLLLFCFAFALMYDKLE